MTTVLALDVNSYIGSKFKGHRLVRDSDGSYSETLPKPTAFEEWLQAELLANGPLKPIPPRQIDLAIEYCIHESLLAA